jgi:hypothetical protein
VAGGGGAVLRREKAVFENWRVWLKELKEAARDVLLEPIVLLLLLATVGLLIMLYFVI